MQLKRKDIDTAYLKMKIENRILHMTRNTLTHTHTHTAALAHLPLKLVRILQVLHVCVCLWLWKLLLYAVWKFNYLALGKPHTHKTRWRNM